VPFKHKDRLYEDVGELASLDFYGSSSISIDYESLCGEGMQSVLTSKL
jgi:hypothetical protein